MKTVIAHLLKGVLPGLLLLSLPLTTIAQPLLPGEVLGAQQPAPEAPANALVSAEVPPPLVTKLAEFGGAVNALAVQGNTAYVATGRRLAVVDVTNPAAPNLVGLSEPGERPITDLAVSGNYVYAVDRGYRDGITMVFYDGLRIYDVSNPAQPTLATTITVPWHPSQIQIVNDLAYVLNALGFVILDISTPTNPPQIGVYSSSVVYGGIVHNTTVYLYDNDVLSVINVANPAAPVRVTGVDLNHRPTSLAVNGNYLHAGTSYNSVDIYDITNPQSPQYASTYAVPDPTGFAFSGSHAFVSTGTSYNPTMSCGVKVFSLANPTAPAAVTDVSIPGCANTVRLSGNYAYAGGANGGLNVINVANPAAPGIAGTYHRVGGPTDIKVDGNNAYLSSGEFHFVNVSNPASPQQLGYNSLNGLIIAGGYGYRLTMNTTPGGTVEIYTISNLQAPQRIAQVTVNGYPSELVADATTAYVNLGYEGGRSGGVQIIDVSNPAQPQKRGLFPTGNPAGTTQGYPYSLALRGQTLYFLEGFSKFHIVNVADLDAPTAIPHSLTISKPARIVLKGAYAYVATGYWGTGNGLTILNISDPAHPTLVGGFAGGGWQHSTSVAVGERYAYIASEVMGVQIIDISNLAAPAAVKFPHAAQDTYPLSVAAEGNKLYVADAVRGLLIFQVDPDLNLLFGEFKAWNGATLSGNFNIVAASNSYSQTVAHKGRYTFPSLPAGIYTLTPASPGYIWEPGATTVTLPRAEASQNDFTGYNITKHGGQTILTPGEIITFTLTATLPQTATHYQIYDAIPTYTTYLTGSLAEPVGVTFSAEHNAIIGTLTLGPNALTEIQYAVRVDGLPAGASSVAFSTKSCLHTGAGDLPPTSCYAESNVLKFHVFNEIHRILLPFISK